MSKDCDYDMSKDCDYESIDYCKGGLWALKELDGGTKSKHDRFIESNFTPLKDHPEWKTAKLCCDDHSYVFEDMCEV